MKFKDSRVIAVIVAVIALVYFALSPREVKRVSPARTQTTEAPRATRRAAPTFRSSSTPTREGASP